MSQNKDIVGLQIHSSFIAGCAGYGGWELEFKNIWRVTHCLSLVWNGDHSKCYFSGGFPSCSSASGQGNRKQVVEFPSVDPFLMTKPMHVLFHMECLHCGIVRISFSCSTTTDSLCCISFEKCQFTAIQISGYLTTKGSSTLVRFYSSLDHY